LLCAICTVSSVLPASAAVSAPVVSVASAAGSPDTAATDGFEALVVSPAPKIDAAYCDRIVGVMLVSTA